MKIQTVKINNDHEIFGTMLIQSELPLKKELDQIQTFT